MPDAWCSWTSAGRTPRLRPCMAGHARGSGRTLRCRATGSEHHLAGEHELERDGTVSGGRRLHDAGGVRGLPGAPFGTRLTARAGRGDGQPLLTQRFSRAAPDRGSGLRAIVLAALLAGSQPHRGSLLEGQGAAAQLRGAYSRSSGRGDGRSTENAITAQDVRGFFAHRGYRILGQLL